VTGNDDMGTFIEVVNAHGQRVRIPRSSLLAHAFGPNSPSSVSSSSVQLLGERLSFGPFADGLWVYVPEMRQAIRDLIVAELDGAIDEDGLPDFPSRFEIMLEFIERALRPAIDGLPDTAPLAGRCVDYLELVEHLRTDTDRLEDILEEGVYRWMTQNGAWRRLEEHCPSLVERLKALGEQPDQ